MIEQYTILRLLITHDIGYDIYILHWQFHSWSFWTLLLLTLIYHFGLLLFPLVFMDYSSLIRGILKYDNNNSYKSIIINSFRWICLCPFNAMIRLYLQCTGTCTYKWPAYYYCMLLIRFQQYKYKWNVCVRYGFAWEHWPDTLEFITRTAELWNRWIGLSCYYNRVYILCPLYKHLFCNALVHVIYSTLSGQYSYTTVGFISIYLLYLWYLKCAIGVR